MKYNDRPSLQGSNISCYFHMSNAFLRPCREMQCAMFAHYRRGRESFVVWMRSARRATSFQRDQILPNFSSGEKFSTERAVSRGKGDRWYTANKIIWLQIVSGPHSTLGFIVEATKTFKSKLKRYHGFRRFRFRSN